MIAKKTCYKQKVNLGAQPWLTARPTRDVIKALTADGAEARFVGGCVRDTLVNRPVKDIDIATPTEPEAVIKLLERFGIKAVATGISHGTVTAVCKKKSFQITTLRRDEETDGRYAKVAFTDDWAVDAMRRDFTINALSADPAGDVYDYNDGITDLKHGKVRFIGNAQDRIDEDYLRILRFFRFQGDYGLPPLDNDAIVASHSRARKLSALSGERVRDELLKILLVLDPGNILYHMQNAGVLDVILPEATNINRLFHLTKLETAIGGITGVAPDSLRRLAALIDPKKNRPAPRSIAARLKFSRPVRSRFNSFIVPQIKLSPHITKNKQMQLLRKIGAEQMRDLILLSWANELTSSTPLPRSQTETYTSFLEMCAGWQAPKFPLTGTDAINLGIPKGPKIGAILKCVEDWWESHGYTADREQCLERIYMEARKTKGQRSD